MTVEMIKIAVITTELEPVMTFTAPTIPRAGEEIWNGDDSYVVENVFWEKPEAPQVQLRVSPLHTPVSDKQIDPDVVEE